MISLRSMKAYDAWNCDRCTFENTLYSDFCEMCENPRRGGGRKRNGNAVRKRTKQFREESESATSKESDPSTTIGDSQPIVCNVCDTLNQPIDKEECKVCGSWLCFVCNRYFPVDLLQDHINEHDAERLPSSSTRRNVRESVVSDRKNRYAQRTKIVSKKMESNNSLNKSIPAPVASSSNQIRLVASGASPKPSATQTAPSSSSHTNSTSSQSNRIERTKSSPAEKLASSFSRSAVSNKEYMPQIVQKGGMILCVPDMDIGCGQLNPEANRRCKKCNKMLISRENTTGDKLRLGQIVYFMRKSGILVDKGILMEIGVDGDQDMLKVRYYERAFRSARYDEVLPISAVFDSIYQSEVGLGPRVRKQTSLQVVEAEFVSTEGLAQKKRAIAKAVPVVGKSELPKRDRHSKERKRKRRKEEEDHLEPGARRYKRRRTSSVTSSLSSDDEEEGLEMRSDEEEDLDGNYREGEENEEEEAEEGAYGSEVTPPVPPEMDIDNENKTAAPAYDQVLRMRHLTTPALTMSTDTILSCLRFSSGRASIGRLDRYHQRALLHWVLRELRRSAVQSSSSSAEGEAQEIKAPSARSGPHITIELLEQILSGCPLNETEFAILPAASDFFSRPRNASGDMAKILATVRQFLCDRLLQTKDYVRSGLYWLFNRHEVPPLFKPADQCTLQDLKVMRPTLPLSYYQFCVAMRLAYQTFGGREVLEGQKGVRGVEPTEHGEAHRNRDVVFPLKNSYMSKYSL